MRCGAGVGVRAGRCGQCVVGWGWGMRAGRCGQCVEGRGWGMRAGRCVQFLINVKSSTVTVCPVLVMPTSHWPLLTAMPGMDKLVQAVRCRNCEGLVRAAEALGVKLRACGAALDPGREGVGAVRQAGYRLVEARVPASCHDQCPVCPPVTLVPLVVVQPAG